MQSNAKAVALMRDLCDKLAKRLAGHTIRQSFDANKWPMAFISASGNEAEGQSVIAIRIANVDAVSKDIFGNSTSAYAPHTLEVAYEVDVNGAPIPSIADRSAVDFESIKVGARWQKKQIANGTAVTEASMNAKAADADLEELYWPTKSV